MSGILTSPTGKAVSVTASDTDAITGGPTRGILVATAGNYTVVLADMGTSTITLYLAAGIVHPLRVKRVNSTGAASTSGIAGFF